MASLFQPPDCKILTLKRIKSQMSLASRKCYVRASAWSYCWQRNACRCLLWPCTGSKWGLRTCTIFWLHSFDWISGEVRKKTREKRKDFCGDSSDTINCGVFTTVKNGESTLNHYSHQLEPKYQQLSGGISLLFPYAWSFSLNSLPSLFHALIIFTIFIPPYHQNIHL